jgi:hypothetical protein
VREEEKEKVSVFLSFFNDHHHHLLSVLRARGGKHQGYESESRGCSRRVVKSSKRERRRKERGFFCFRFLNCSSPV